MLNEVQKKNLFVFLSRVDLKGSEVEAYAEIMNVLYPKTSETSETAVEKDI